MRLSSNTGDIELYFLRFFLFLCFLVDTLRDCTLSFECVEVSWIAMGLYDS